MLCSLIIATYAVLTAIELKRERRKPQSRAVRAIVVPILHGAIFLSPILTMHFIPDGGSTTGAGAGKSSFALFALLTLLYVVGTAFIVVVMAKEHAVLLHKTAAMTDPLTGLFNRRGYQEAAQRLIEMQARKGEPVTVLMFDLDHFKSINDRFGHAGRRRSPAGVRKTASSNMRGADIVGRLGGEEFSAILPGDVDIAFGVAERVRAAFDIAGEEIANITMRATVSIGAAVRAGKIRASRGPDRAGGHGALQGEIRRAQPRGRGLESVREAAAQAAPPLVPVRHRARTARPQCVSRRQLDAIESSRKPLVYLAAAILRS